MVSIVGRKIGQIAECGGVIWPAGDGLAVIFTGALLIAGLAVDRSQSEPKFGSIWSSRQGRRQKRFGGFELSLAAQQIGEIDEGFQSLGLNGKDAAVELLGRAIHTQRARRVAKREQCSRIAWVERQGMLELLDRLGMQPLGGKLQSSRIGIASHDTLIALAPLRAR